MKTLFSRLITVIACFFLSSLPHGFACGVSACIWLSALIWRCCYFRLVCVWGLMLQCPRGYWPVLLGAEWLLIYWLTQAVGLTHFPLLMIGSLLTLLPVALISRYRHQRDWRTFAVTGGGVNGGGVVAVAAPALARQRVVECAVADFNWRPDAGPRYVWCSGTISPITPGCRSVRHWFLSQSTGAGDIWSGTCCCLLSVSGSSWDCRTNCRALRHSVWRCRLSRWPWHYGWQGALIATLMNAIALIASQTLARSSGGFIALAAGAKSDRVVAWRWHPAVA